MPSAKEKSNYYKHFYSCIVGLLHKIHCGRMKKSDRDFIPHKKDLVRLCITLPPGDCAITPLKKEELVPIKRDTSVTKVK